MVGAANLAYSIQNLGAGGSRTEQGVAVAAAGTQHQFTSIGLHAASCKLPLLLMSLFYWFLRFFGG